MWVYTVIASFQGKEVAGEVGVGEGVQGDTVGCVAARGGDSGCGWEPLRALSPLAAGSLRQKQEEKPRERGPGCSRARMRDGKPPPPTPTGDFKVNPEGAGGEVVGRGHQGPLSALRPGGHRPPASSRGQLHRPRIWLGLCKNEAEDLVGRESERLPQRPPAQMATPAGCWSPPNLRRKAGNEAPRPGLGPKEEAQWPEDEG